MIRSHVRSLASAALIRAGAVAIAAVTASTLAACGGSSSDSGTSSGSSTASGSATKALKIGFSPFSLQPPALKGLADGLTAAAKAQGDTVLTADPKGDPSTQLQQLQQWIQLGRVDAIWVIPTSGQSIAAAIKQAQAKGIVVIASGVPSDYGLQSGEPGITFTNVDNAAFGGKLGELAGKCITERLSGNGQVISLVSPSGQQSSKDINTNVKSALTTAAPNAKIVNEQQAKDRLGSQQAVSSALQGAPNANALIGTDDEATLGGLAAFQQAGKDPAKNCLVGAGGNEEAVKAVKDGKLYGEVAFDFQKDLAQNLQQLHKMANDPKAPGEQIVTPIQVITATS
jgi:ABC-type sugar transport system substrate-binding protein